MKVLVACEESQRVCIAFRKRGHEAYSCDILPCSGGHPEYTLEWAFDILGWENPHPVPECECEIDGCHEHATCGTPTKDGYKRVCGKHFVEIQEEA